MKLRLGFALWMLACTAGALALRIPALDRRPMHGDEAVHALKLGALLEHGVYRYDPREYHGPTLYFLTLPLLWAAGTVRLADANETLLRLLPALLGAGFVPLLVLLRRRLGRVAVGAAGALTALSPALVFYSRDYIHETLLVFFLFLVLASGARFAESRRAGWAALAGLAAGLVLATKETGILGLAAMAAAEAGARRLGRRGGGPPPPPPPARGAGRGTLRRAALLAAGVALATALLLDSSFLTHPGGILDAARALPAYLSRGLGGGLHRHPWHYYLGTLLYRHDAPGPRWSEGLIVGLAAAGGVAALTGLGIDPRRRPMARFVTLYVALLTIAFSAIPYKTPWNLLAPLHGMVLLAGIGASALLAGIGPRAARAAAGTALVLGAWQLGAQAWRASFRYDADPRNPYAYAQPTRDVVRLGRRVEELASLHPDGRKMLVRVIAPDPWPLPWYLRRLERVGYWEEPPPTAPGRPPLGPAAPVLVVAAELAPRLPEPPGQPYATSYYGLRPGAVLELLVEPGLWKRFVEGRARAHDPGKGRAPR